MIMIITELIYVSKLKSWLFFMNGLKGIFFEPFHICLQLFATFNSQVFFILFVFWFANFFNDQLLKKCDNKHQIKSIDQVTASVKVDYKLFVLYYWHSSHPLHHDHRRHRLLIFINGSLFFCKSARKLMASDR